jgi:AraC family transcriptional regulator, ethanolamine operon transcriptional activator
MFVRTRAVSRRFSVVVTPSLPHPARRGSLDHCSNCHVPLTIEIPQTVKISPRSTNPVIPTRSSVVTVVEISDPTAVGETIEVIEQDAVQLKSRPLRARQVVVHLGTNILTFQSTNLPIRTRTKLQTGFVAFVAFGPQAAGTLNGLPVGPDRVLACTSGIEVEFVVAGGYESVSFFLPPDDIRAHLRGRYREDEFRVPHGVELLQPSPAAAHGLYGFGRRLADVAAWQPALFDVPQTQAAAQIDLLETLLATLGSPGHVEPVAEDRTRQAHSRVVQTAEDYALSHTAERLYVTDLCEAAAVSERTLQYAFREVMGMTPVAYLSRLRLHRVRHALRTASQASTTVTTEALRWGFWHFGDFSRAYKDCFGELPSETLRRKPHGAIERSSRDVR